MRELRVIGVTPDSAHIVCVDTESGQKFRLPADDKLRAAARGDLARFGQIEIEMEATMRPRDIQARIRAGASVEQVTQESGMPVSRVDRFAYPVLLERSRAAELAQKAHPIRPDGPAVEILIDVVTAAFSARGHTLDNAEWDAWKDEKGFWVAQLQWQNGRSEIAAHWRYQPDAHGGTVSPLDDPATDLIDPDFGRALRGLASILPVEPDTPATAQSTMSGPRREPARPAFYEQHAVAAGGSATLPPATPLSPGGPAALPAAPAASAPVQPAPAQAPQRPAETQPAAEFAPPVARPVPAPSRPVRDDAAPVVPASTEAETSPAAEATVADDSVTATVAAVTDEPTAPDTAPADTGPAEAAPAEAGPAEAADTDAEVVETATADTVAAGTAENGPGGEPAKTDEVVAEAAAPEAAAKPAARKAPAAKSTSRGKRGKAPMPSWEDVLLGVRSSGH